MFGGGGFGGAPEETTAPAHAGADDTLTAEDEMTLDQLRDLYPDVSESILKECVRNSCGDVDMAMDLVTKKLEDAALATPAKPAVELASEHGGVSQGDVTTMHALFPEESEYYIRQLLVDHGGDFDRAHKAEKEKRQKALEAKAKEAEARRLKAEQEATAASNAESKKGLQEDQEYFEKVGELTKEQHDMINEVSSIQGMTPAIAYGVLKVQQWHLERAMNVALEHSGFS